jgi:hypothetical protein
VVLVGLAPDRLGLRLDPGDGVEDGDRAVEDAEAAYWSFKSIDLQSRRSYPVLFLVAVGLAAVVASPELVMLVLAYVYLASGIVAVAWQRLRRRPAASARGGDTADDGSVA